MYYREKLPARLFGSLNVFLLFVFAATIVLPFLHFFAISVSDPVEVGFRRVRLLPRGIQWESYRQVFQQSDIVLSYWNSLRYAFLSTVFVLFFCSLGGFVLSREFRGRRLYTTILAVTLFFGGGLIPTYLTILKLGLLDSALAVTLPSAFAMWYVVLMRTNFQSIPESLIEAAFMDGANELYIYVRIVLPLSKAILATIGLFACVASWNNYVGPLLYLNSQDKLPLPVILRRVLIDMVTSSGVQDYTDELLAEERDPVVRSGMYESVRMATFFVALGPIVLVYPFAQRYFVRGVMVGSIKG